MESLAFSFSWVLPKAVSKKKHKITAIMSSYRTNREDRLGQEGEKNSQAQNMFKCLNSSSFA